MKTNKNAKRYAKMFINSVGMDKAHKAIEELAVLGEIIGKSRDFRSLLVNPAFSSAERAKAIKSVTDKLGYSDATARFLGFLAEQGAGEALSQVVEKAIGIYLEHVGTVKARVVTPKMLGADYDARLKAAIAKLTGKKVEVEYSEDSSLIGGVLIKIGSTMYDCSIKGQLRLLKDELIKG